MDFGKYMGASPVDQLRMMIEAMKAQEESLKPENFLTASPVDKLRILVHSMQEEDRKVQSGYYQNAPYHEQIVFIAKQIQEQVRKETEKKINDLKFYLEIIENNKKYVVAQLDAIDKSHPDVGNLEEVNALLDKLIYILKEELDKQTKLSDLEN